MRLMEESYETLYQLNFPRLLAVYCAWKGLEPQPRGEQGINHNRKATAQLALGSLLLGEKCSGAAAVQIAPLLPRDEVRSRLDIVWSV
jgi:hypothetical protein